jgi:hypothetical protein
MKEAHTNTIEQLVEIGSFDELHTAQQQVVLNEMSADEFDSIRNTMIADSPLISMDNFNINPNPELLSNLQEKLQLKSGRVISLPRMFFYTSAVAASLILAVFSYFSLFQTSPKLPKYSIVTLTNDTLQALPSTGEKDALLATHEKNTPIHNTSFKESTKTEPAKSNSNPPEEFIVPASDMLMCYTSGDEELALYSGESEHDFHYYTRLSSENKNP